MVVQTIVFRGLQMPTRRELLTSTAPLPPDPKLQGLRPFIDFAPVDPIARPSQQFRQFVVSQTAEFTEIIRPAKATSD